MIVFIDIVVSWCLSYLIGAIPTGFLIARRCGIEDIRQHGSGNIGATNVARILGMRFFCLILLLDAGKAFANIVLLQYLSYSPFVIYCAALLHLVANGYSPFLSWSGGKGVATLFGLLCALKWHIAFYAALIWIGVCITTCVAGIASVMTALMVPIVAWYMHCSEELILFFVCTSIWVLIRHKNNLKIFFAHI
ncbi:MAG TPA: glycerol-3-phosphate acyltransferase [Candidatus Babeliales bacterium]|jgi:glycerol-3-phosphate acyltransferase PlsY|nr:glycerol-3-phosphate acyltransferase [Candidatus Babeliales bacterium]